MGQAALHPRGLETLADPVLEEEAVGKSQLTDSVRIKNAVILHHSPEIIPCMYPLCQRRFLGDCFDTAGT